MYAVIRCGGKQYKVAPGETIQVEKLDGKVGAKVTFGDVVAVRSDEKNFLTGDKASGAKITGKIKFQDKGKSGRFVSVEPAELTTA